MRSPNGNITTQYDLHRAERAGDVKFDFLVTDICDKLAVAINLLKDNGYFQGLNSLREIYNKYLHPQVIDIKILDYGKLLKMEKFKMFFNSTPQ